MEENPSTHELMKESHLTKVTEADDSSPGCDNVDAFLNKIPPDWHKAELHGNANKVVFHTLLNL